MQPSLRSFHQAKRSLCAFLFVDLENFALFVVCFALFGFFASSFLAIFGVAKS